MTERFGKRLAACVLLASSTAALSAETVVVINRTGRAIEIVQAAPDGRDQWGDDLIPGSTVLDGESVSLDLIGPAPWAFRLMDSAGEVYVLYDIDPAFSGKLTVGPEHLARLSDLAGTVRRIRLNNMTGETLVSLRISPSSDGEWGGDVLAGRSVRNGEIADIVLQAAPGALSFDIRFDLLVGNDEIPYVKDSVILTDGASLVLTSSSLRH
jgi:hypothetical protein